MSEPKISTAKPGEFTLVFNTNDGVVHPVGLQKHQHDLLQSIVSTMACMIKDDTIGIYVPNPNYKPENAEQNEIRSK